MDYKIDIPKDFNDYAFCTLFGEHQERLGISKELKVYDKLIINFAMTEWASPLAMLGCLCLIKEYFLRTTNKQQPSILVDLGRSRKKPSSWKDENHNIFLKFFLSQGFLDAFKEFSKFELNGIEYLGEEKIVSLRYYLHSFTDGAGEVFRSSDFIKAQILTIQNYLVDGKISEMNLQDLTEKLMDEAGKRVIDSFFTSDPQLRDHYFQKLRIIIREIISNAIEHAYLTERQKFGQIGIYARLRTKRIIAHPISKESVERLERETQNEKKHTKYPTLANFNHPDFNDWIEFFVCDIGIGLTNPENLRAWKESLQASQKELGNNAEILKIISILDRAQSDDARNPLRLLKEKLFSFDFSRLLPSQRRDEVRSQMTGLRHVGLTLTKENDFLRIYANGEWVGADHPWRPNDTANHLLLPKVSGYAPAKGTLIHVCIPNKYRTKYPENWITCENDLKINETLKDALGTKQSLLISGRDHKEKILALQKGIGKEFPGIYFINKRGGVAPIDTDLERIKSGKDELIQKGFRCVILRAARAMSKNELYRCLNFFIGTPWDDSGHKPGRPIFELDMLVFADLSPFQGLVFESLITDILSRLPKGNRPNILLQTEDWSFFLLCRDQENCCFDHKPLLGIKCLPFDVKQLFSILRLDDSLMFWVGKRLDEFLRSRPEDIEPDDECYLAQDIKWSETKGQNAFISGYLDLPQALADHQRFEAVRRALQRALSLYKTCRPEAADSLVGALITEVDKRIQYRHLLSDDVTNSLVVGSILVTGNTVDNLDREGVPYIHLFIHPGTMLLNAGKLPRTLDWLPVGHSSVQLIGPERIRETPFIGSRGDFGIGLDRGGSESYQQPNIAYQVWRQLKVLKIGHWVYEGHHDLLTINPFRAFDLSSLDGDTDPYRWLNDLLKVELKEKEKKYSVLVYPSHPSVDLIIDKMRLNKDRIFPIKFLGHSTVSPFRASPLGLERLSCEIKSLKKNGSLVTAIIFDDATRTGKMMNELSQIARHAGADKVRTISLVDRSGLPAYDSLLAEQLREHPRLWRWDIPKLGHDRDCPLCAALAMQHNTLNDFAVTSLKERINEIAGIWRTRRLIEDWATAEELTHKFNSPKTLNFIDPTTNRVDTSIGQLKLFPDDSFDINNKEGRLPVDHTSAISYTSMCLEITRLSTRADLPLLKQAEHFSKDSDTSLILLTSQLFLFYDELTSKQRFERMKKLLEVLLQEGCITSPWSGLAALAFSLCDEKMARKLWSEFQILAWANFEKREKNNPDLLERKLNWVESPDLFLSVHLIRKIGFERDSKVTPSSESTIAKSSFELRLDGVDLNKDSVRGNIEKLFHYVGLTNNQSHMTRFHRAITKYDNNADLGEENTNLKLKNKIIRMTNDIADVLERLSNNYLCFDDSDEIKNHLRSVKDQIISATRDNNIEKLKEIFFGDTDHAFSKYLRQTFLVSAGLERPVTGVERYIESLGNKISSIIGETESGWETYFSNMLDRKKNYPNERNDLINRWENISKPRINRFSQSEPAPSSSHYLLWTPAIKEYLAELLRNCIWRTEPLIGDCETVSDMEYEWTEVDIPDTIQPRKGIRLRLMNLCDAKRECFTLKDSLYKGDAERMGLSISFSIEPYEKKNKRVFNRICLDVFSPYFNSEQ